MSQLHRCDSCGYDLPAEPNTNPPRLILHDENGRATWRPCCLGSGRLCNTPELVQATERYLMDWYRGTQTEELEVAA